jgi:site-specific recombinase XerD
LVHDCIAKVARFLLIFMAINGNVLAMIIRPAKANGKNCWCLDARDAKQGRAFFPTKGKAQTALESLKQQLQVKGEAWLALDAGERLEILSVHAEASKAGVTIRDLWTAYKKESLLKPISLGTAIAKMLADKRAIGRRERYVRRLEAYLGAFARGREEVPISEIGTQEIKAWFASRSEAPETRRSNTTACLSSLFEFCWRERHIEENPCRRLESVTVQTKTPKILSVEQCRKALDWTASEWPHYLAWLSLTLLAGLRPESEADPLTWEDIDLERGTIRIEGEHTKTHVHRIIDLSLNPLALQWLQLAKVKNSVLPNAFTGRRRYIRRLRNELGLKAWPQDVLRHTAASNLFAYHQDAGKIAAFLGNSVGVLLRRYKALIHREDAVKWFAMSPQ